MTIYEYKPRITVKYIEYNLGLVLSIVGVGFALFLLLAAYRSPSAGGTPLPLLLAFFAFVILMCIMAFFNLRSRPKSFQVDVEDEHLFLVRKGKRFQIKKVFNFDTFSACKGRIIYYKCQVETQDKTIRLNFYNESEMNEFSAHVKTKAKLKSKSKRGHVSLGVSMTLKCDALDEISNASESDIRMVFANDVLKWDYVILSESEDIYIQAVDDGDDTFLLEYRDGDRLHHFQCIQKLQKGTIEHVFLKYLKSDTNWQNDFPWELLK